MVNNPRLQLGVSRNATAFNARGVVKWERSLGGWGAASQEKGNQRWSTTARNPWNRDHDSPAAETSSLLSLFSQNRWVVFISFPNWAAISVWRVRRVLIESQILNSPPSCNCRLFWIKTILRSLRAFGILKCSNHALFAYWKDKRKNFYLSDPLHIFAV